MLAMLLASALPICASAQTQVFVPGNASGFFGNGADIQVEFVPAITVQGPATITVTYLSGTVTDAGGVNTGPNGATWNTSGSQSPMQESQGIAGGTIENLDALIGAFVPASTIDIPGVFSPLDGTKDVAPVGVMPNTLLLVGDGITYNATEAGTLYLGINDWYVSDNGGGYTVQVAATPVSESQDSTQFSARANPSGEWSYGWSQSQGASFKMDTRTFSTMGLDGWASECCESTKPDVYHNPTSKAVSPTGTDPIPAKSLALRPGSEGENAILRWTASISGRYTVKATFTGLNGVDLPRTAASIFLNQVEIFSGQVIGAGASHSQAFYGTVSMLPGDNLDFAVGVGEKGNFLHSTTGLNVEITPAK
ncbi:MAG: hypothetical protein WBE76_27705 [Terracidiphilus sp.]